MRTLKGKELDEFLGDKDTVYITTGAFDIARLGKDELYKTASENFYWINGVSVKITDMSLIPFLITDGGEVEYIVEIHEIKIEEEEED